MVNTVQFPTLDALMAAAGCTAYPARWQEIFDTVMADFDQNGCLCTDPAYYDMLHEKYGVLNRHLDVFKEAAVAVGKREPLARLLALLVATLRDREHVSMDLKEFQQPRSPEGTHDLAVDMLTGLALFAMVPYTAEKIAPRKLPAYISDYILQNCEMCVDYYRARYGVPGCNLITWYQLPIEGHLFRVGRLEIQLCAKFRGGSVYENGRGERVTLCHDKLLHRDGFPLGAYGYTDETGSFEATLTATDTAYIGYPYLPNGHVATNTVTLLKSEWRQILTNDDPVISLHIPGGGGLSPAVVDETLTEAKKVLATYFPDIPYKAFACSSWLIDPQLIQLVGEDANIAKFARRFTPMAQKSQGNGVMNFVFFDPDRRIPTEDLPEDTRLQRALKQHYLQGKVIYEMFGYFF
ncbi:MAG: hypothetical protein IJW51_06670 [Clostridia bacterium]|nr:hypothetical protein [Clostridia bacterium]